MSSRKHPALSIERNILYGSYYSGKCESSKLTPTQSELLLVNMEISDIERFIRKKKLEIINKNK